MIGLAFLLGYAVLLGTVVPLALSRARWVVRAPRLAIRLWQALSISWLAAIVLGGVVLMQPWLHSIAGWGRPGIDGLISTAVGAALVVGVLARVGCVAAGELRAARGTRRWHAAVLVFAGRRMAGRDAMILEQDRPAVYCLPGSRRRQRIVVTTGALRALSGEDLDAVLAHERAHLHMGHHRLLARSAVLMRSLPVPLFRHACREIAILAEMAADDAAARAHGRPALAAALLRLARAGTPDATLAAGEYDSVRRLQRLLAPPPPLGLPWRLAGTGTAAGVLAVPAALACTAVAALATLMAL